MTFAKNYISLLRINHWFKNLFIFVGSISAILINNLQINFELMVQLILTFFLASFVSSANYLINQITDAYFDAKHPKKKTRPIPSGKVSKEIAFIFSIIIFLTTFFYSLKTFDYNFSVMIFVFWLAGILYNVKPIRLKDVPFIDVLSESANNPIRFLLGWFAVSPIIFPSINYLLLSWSIGAVLMTAKRYDELLNFGKDLVPYRKTFKVYTLQKLNAFLIGYTFISLVLFYLIARSLNPNLLILLPVIFPYVFWLLRSIISGNAKARNIEKFVMTKTFLFFTSIVVLSLIFLLILFK